MWFYKWVFKHNRKDRRIASRGFNPSEIIQSQGLGMSFHFRIIILSRGEEGVGSLSRWFVLHFIHCTQPAEAHSTSKLFFFSPKWIAKASHLKLGCPSLSVSTNQIPSHDFSSRIMLQTYFIISLEHSKCNRISCLVTSKGAVFLYLYIDECCQKYWNVNEILSF